MYSSDRGDFMDMVTGMPALRILLAAIIILSFLVEIKTGGVGVGVLLGLVAAGILFGAQYVHGLVSLNQIGLFLMGILCIAVEILLPTIGLIAGIGVALMAYSLVLALGGDINGLYALLAAAIIAVVIFVLILKKLPSSKLWNRVILRNESTSDHGFVSAEPRDELLGHAGIVITDLRPAGAVEIDGNPVDVVSDGSYIKKGEKVIVASVNGSRVVVRRVKEDI